MRQGRFVAAIREARRGGTDQPECPVYKHSGSSLKATKATDTAPYEVHSPSFALRDGWVVACMHKIPCAVCLQCHAPAAPFGIHTKVRVSAEAGGTGL